MAKKNPITSAREAKGWSLEQLARETNLPVATIRRTESALTASHRVDPGVVEKIVATLGKPAEQLFNAQQLKPPRRTGRSKPPGRGVVCTECRTEIPLVYGRTCPECN